MNAEIDNKRRCRRVTKQGVPCRNRTVIGSDYCFSHSISQRRGWIYYIGLIGSVASIVSLVIIFIPSRSKIIPFYMTSLDIDVFSIRGSFEGEMQILPESIEVTVNKANVYFSEKFSNVQKESVISIDAGLGMNNGSHWTIAQRSQEVPVNLTLLPGERVTLTNLHFSIPKKNSVDISHAHLIITFHIKDLDGSEGTTHVHSNEGIFSIY